MAGYGGGGGWVCRDLVKHYPARRERGGGCFAASVSPFNTQWPVMTIMNTCKRSNINDLDIFG